MSLPIFQDSNKNLMLMQTAWASQLNALLSQAFNSGNIIKNVKLSAGTNIVNHKLGQAPQGYFATRWQSGTVNFYDTQSSNPTPTLTLVLVASGAATVDLFIF